METLRQKIERLANDYINDTEYQKGFIREKWITKITNELDLQHLSDYELANMWDMVWLTLENLYTYYDEKDVKKAWKYMDTQSAFTEVVNMEVRRRKGK